MDPTSPLGQLFGLVPLYYYNYYIYYNNYYYYREQSDLTKLDLLD